MIDQLIKIHNLIKEYKINKDKVCILNNINFSLTSGEIISITGPSGSGKSTFLNILGLLDSNYNGNYHFLNTNVNDLKISDKNIIRNQSIGFVHQFFHLIPELNILENVSLPHLIMKNNYKESFEEAKKIIFEFGLKERLYSKPSDLSGGEQQRVSIAIITVGVIIASGVIVAIAVGVRLLEICSSSLSKISKVITIIIRIIIKYISLFFFRFIIVYNFGNEFSRI